MVNILTDAACRKFAPGAKRRRIRDAAARSLFLIVEPSGHKAWQMRFRRPDGRPGKITLGPFDRSGRELTGDPQIGQPLTLQAARQLAATVHRDRALGHDVVADHRARRHRQRTEIEERAANTFAAAARAYVDEHARPQTRNWLETARLLGLRYPKGDGEPEEAKGGLAQRWADRPVAGLDAHDVWSVIDEASRVAIPGIAARNRGISDARGRALFAALSSMFSWLKRQRRVESNPCAGVHSPAGPKARDRVLTADEIRWFWVASESVDAPSAPGAPRLFGPLLKLLLLTGQRRNEVAGMRRNELHDDGTWHLPGSRTKNGRGHIVPLSPLVRELIASVKAKPGSPLIFTTTGTTPVSGWSRMKDRLDVAMLAAAREEGRTVSQPWRLHDLRRSAVTGMVELRVPPHVVELVVNHISGTRAGVAGTYNRSELMEERKEALERWATHVARIVAPRPGNVVSLPRERRRK